jgi:WD40 repeat protein
VVNLIKLNLSHREVEFTPDDFRDFSRTENFPAEGDFQVTITNTSQQFASFHVELATERVDPGFTGQWYRVEPNVSAKKPPGARSTFNITLLKAPVPRCDLFIPITVQAFSVEIEDLLAEASLSIKICRPHRILDVYFPLKDLAVHPGQDSTQPIDPELPSHISFYPGRRLPIPVMVYNLDNHSQFVNLKLSGLTPNWFPEGVEQKIVVDAGDYSETTFYCAPPETSESVHGVYEIKAEAIPVGDRSQSGNNALAFAKVEILPYGKVEFDCFKALQWIPSQKGSGGQKRADSAIFDLILNNRSNLSLRVDFPISVNLDSHIEAAGPIESQILDLGESRTVPVPVRAKRPWLGPTRTRFLTVAPEPTYPKSREPVKQVVTQPASQVLTLKIRPIIPLLLQIGGAALAAFLLWLAWFLNPTAGHDGPVNGLTLMANGSTVISGSSDRTLKRWQVRQAGWLPDVRRLPLEGELQDDGNPQRAVRTLQHLPSEVKKVAVGLENGEVQIWDISESTLDQSFYERGKPDRVFALDFTNDSRYLLTGHGSGMVRQWDLLVNRETPVQKLLPNAAERFAITALTVVEPSEQEQFAVVGGQFNRMLLWDWEQRQAYTVSYNWQTEEDTFNPVVSRQSYITDLTSTNVAGLFASADTDGIITIWNVQSLFSCMDQAAAKQLLPGQEAEQHGNRGSYNNQYIDLGQVSDCIQGAIADRWQASPEGQAVRSVALAETGCYLASVGDDGQVNLWSLTNDGQRVTSGDNPAVLQAFQGSLNNVDIHYSRQGDQETVWVVSDTPNYRVRINRKQVSNHGCN